MLPDPQALWSVAQIRAIDAFAIGALRIPGYELMRRAAAASLRELRQRWPSARALCVLCGGGNNGGDGYVLARLAQHEGLDVMVGALVDPARLAGDAAQAFADWRTAGGAIVGWREALGQAQARRPADAVIVDAMLGTGAGGALRGEFLAAVEALNAQRRRVLALDVPTGLSAQTGQVENTCVRADCTVTFIAHKPGLWLGAGPDCSGELRLADLDLPSWPDDLGQPFLQTLRPSLLGDSLAPRPRGANKGSFGHVLVLGGGPGMPGAARLCGEAALRVGAGLVSVATAAEHAGQIAASRPELMVSGIADAAGLMPLLQRADVIAIGPGLGQSAWARSLWSCAMASALPMVVDADALNLLAAQPETRAAWVLTPHPGEAGRLLGVSTEAVQADRLAAVSELQRRYGGSVVLKGAGSLVATPVEQDRPLAADHSQVQLCTAGNPGMAAPGMGDVLTGIIAGLFGQLRDLPQAARLGVLVHALAGDRAAGAAPRGLLASDLLAELRACVMNPTDH